MNQDRSSVAYLSREMAKLYKALGSKAVASLRVGSRVDALAGQFELDPVYINAAGLRWLRAAETLMASLERDSISLDDMVLAFEAGCACYAGQSVGIGNVGSRDRCGVWRVNVTDLEAEFEKHDDEYIKFENIKDPPCKRPDLCAFLLLDKLVPGDRDIVSGSEHDEIFIGIEAEELAKVATSENILYLTRCGVRYDSSTDSLAMFT